METLTEMTEAEKTAKLKALRLERDAKRRKMRPIEIQVRIFKLTDIIPFGKHKGKTLETVLEEDRGWVVWALENIKGFELNPEAEAEFQAGDDPRSPSKAWASPRY